MKCRCPLWVDGGERREFRRSLKTRDLQKAMAKAVALEKGETVLKTVPEAVKDFLGANPELAVGTLRNYKRALREFAAFAEREGLNTIQSVRVEHIDAFREHRDLSALTWSKELQVLRSFFTLATDRDWVRVNVAKKAKMPKNLKPKPKKPYTSEDMISILASCDQIGRGPYERLRARAMVLLMRYSGLRISDVSIFRRDQILDGFLQLHTMKNGKPIRLPVPAVLDSALQGLPKPRGADGEWKYVFWSGNGSTESVIRDVTRTMNAVFKKSGVAGAHAHRFRHTLATEILESGGTIEDAANILGSSPLIIRRHYEQWTITRQDRISSLMQTVHGGTFLAQTQTLPSKSLI